VSALERLGSWLARALGGGDDPAADAPEESDTDAPDDEGLDPSGATETRTTGQDDAVTALRETRRGRGAGSDPDPPARTDDRDEE
jgi:hypothetical protein